MWLAFTVWLAFTRGKADSTNPLLRVCRLLLLLAHERFAYLRIVPILQRSSRGITCLFEMHQQSLAQAIRNFLVLGIVDEIVQAGGILLHIIQLFRHSMHEQVDPTRDGRIFLRSIPHRPECATTLRFVSEIEFAIRPWIEDVAESPALHTAHGEATLSRRLVELGEHELTLRLSVAAQNGQEGCPIHATRLGHTSRLQNSGHEVDAANQVFTVHPPWLHNARPTHDPGCFGADQVAVRLRKGQRHAVVAQKHHKCGIRQASLVKCTQNLAHGLVATVHGCEILRDLLTHVGQVRQEAWNRDCFQPKRPSNGWKRFRPARLLLIASCERAVRIMRVRHQEEGLILVLRTFQKRLRLLIVAGGTAANALAISEFASRDIHVPAELRPRRKVALLAQDTVEVARLVQRFLKCGHIQVDGFKTLPTIPVRVAPCHETLPAGLAHSDGHMSVLKAHPLRSQSVKVGCNMRDRTPKCAYGIIVEIVCCDEEEVRHCCGGLGRHKATHPGSELQLPWRACTAPLRLPAWSPHGAIHADPSQSGTGTWGVSRSHPPTGR